MRSGKAETNARWTSSHEYRTTYDSIFRRSDTLKAMDIFDDGFRKFQKDAGRNPVMAFVGSTQFILLQHAWQSKPSLDGRIMMYGVKVQEDPTLKPLEANFG